jgi:HEAT repeats/Putative zinc-finger
MSCDEIKDRMPLFLYGELSFDEEEFFERHLAGCESCRRELARVRKMHELVIEAALTPSLPLLAECRRELRSQSGAGVLALKRPTGRFWLQALAAAAMLAIGFFAAKAPVFNAGGNYAGVTASRVRNIEPDREGRVQIVVDETRQRVLSGKIDDANIRMLMISASREQSDPGLRAESVELLKSRCGSTDVREALLQALQHDNNSGVRLKALDGLRPYALQPEVRKALSYALLSDDTPAIRTQAIDLLTASRPSDVVGVLQQLMEKEQDNYIRLRSIKALREMNASAGTF